MDILRKPPAHGELLRLALYFTQNIEAKHRLKIVPIWVPFTGTVTPNNVFLYSLLSFFLKHIYIMDILRKPPAHGELVDVLRHTCSPASSWFCGRRPRAATPTRPPTG